MLNPKGLDSNGEISGTAVVLVLVTFGAEFCPQITPALFEDRRLLSSDWAEELAGGGVRMKVCRLFALDWRRGLLEESDD